MMAAARQSHQTQAPDAVQRRLVGFDRLVALGALAYVALNAADLAAATHLVVLGSLTAVFVAVVFYADYRYRLAGKR